jgi:exopolyphosphatase/guanosine-5'-triphosphate,3'-diphosphate pyrophosphatase
MLLEAAALLHEVGNFISATEHHKHSHYLITHTPLIGLTESQRAIVANVARYHRKSFPTLRHEPYRALATKNRVAVSKLAALLRLADALDNEHDAKVSAIHIELNKHQMLLRLEGDGDLLLEKWALTRKTDLFKEVFGLKVTVSD